MHHKIISALLLFFLAVPTSFAKAPDRTTNYIICAGYFDMFSAMLADKKQQGLSEKMSGQADLFRDLAIVLEKRKGTPSFFTKNMIYQLSAKLVLKRTPKKFTELAAKQHMKCVSLAKEIKAAKKLLQTKRLPKATD